MIIDENSFAHLAGLAQSGDREAYRVLLEASQTWLKRYYARRISPCQLDDLVQDTLMSLHRKLSSYDASRPFLPWLAAVARYRWVDHLRKVYRANETELDGDYESPSGEAGISARISLERLFTQLPSSQVEAIELVKIEGLSISEAAHASGQSESLVKVNIHRGLKRLAALVEKA
jgi:RNA polymerase sigma factor (sigma-70 family)